MAARHEERHISDASRRLGGDVSEELSGADDTPGEVISASGGLGKRPVPAKHPVQRRPLRVLFLSVEVEGFAKTGGLGDVAASLPKALHAQGVDVRVCLPRYGPIPESMLAPEPAIERLEVPLGDWQEPVTIRQG